MTNRLVAIVHTKPVIAILVLSLVAMATSLRRSILAMSSLDSLTLKTYPESLVANSRSYTDSNLPASHHTPRGQPISKVGGDPFPVWCGCPHLAIYWLYCFRFPDFPSIREWRVS